MNVFNRVTLRTLAGNKVRTVVTIVGIILSAAMFTAVTTFVSSLQDFLVDVMVEREGDWHGAAYSVDLSQTEKLENNAKVRSYTSLQIIGYSPLAESKNEYKPYLFIGGMADNFTEMMPVHLTDGRLPQNSSEILLPTHLMTNGGIRYSIGGTLSPSVGDRVLDGEPLNQNDAYLSGQDGESGEDGKKEELKIDRKLSYTVVGFYERPGFEDYSAPGYTALTMADPSADQADYLYDVYIKMNNPKDIYSFLSDQFPESGSRTHTGLLRFMGASDEDNFNKVLYSLAAILIVLIMFGSVSLIYNAFSISVSERTRQYGLLSSVGATKRQMMGGVMFEAFFLSAIGIPIGILAGILGIGVTLRLTRNLFLSFLGMGSRVVLDLAVSWGAVAVAAVLGLVTVLISAYIPAKRAVRISAIDAIRQTNDIRIRPGKVKTSKLTYKLFGFEGMLARKNFKRNRRKYRATVISLFMSVVLFISASSFCAYLSGSVGSVMGKPDYDIIYSMNGDTAGTTGKIPVQELYRELASVEGVTEAAYAITRYASVEVPADLINKDYLEYLEKSTGRKITIKTLEMAGSLYFVNDDCYEEYLNDFSLDKATYMRISSPKAMVLDFFKTYNGTEKKYYTFRLLNSGSFSASLLRTKEVEGYSLSRTETDEAGAEYYIYKNDQGKETRLKAEEAKEKILVQLGAVTESKPFCVDYNHAGLTLIYPYGAMEEILGSNGEEAVPVLYFRADDHKAVYEKIYKALYERGLPTQNLFDYTESVESDRAVISVINIFSYGFIVLISLIAAANVFNTISTNIGLRRREFAMLKSIGMTQKGFKKMMNFECLLYGFKGLAFGIPVSFGVTYLIYQSIRGGLESSFFVPWNSVLIAVGSVFAVVFSTMLYSMNKIKKDNPIDALRNENI